MTRLRKPGSARQPKRSAQVPRPDAGQAQQVPHPAFAGLHRLQRVLRAPPPKPATAPTPPRPVPPGADAATLFRQAVSDVTPLQRSSPVLHPLPAPSPHPRQRLNDDPPVMHDAMSDHGPWDEAETGDELRYLRSGQKRDTLRRLRRGHWVVQGELDLHGMDTDSARSAVGAFLHTCVQQNRRCVRIIHGKGLSSKYREPVLKHKLRNWLIQRDEVLAYRQARAVDGGAGAVLVLLRGPPR